MGKILGSAPKVETPSAPAANAERDAEAERKKALERQRRGLESSIRTSYNGILSSRTDDLKRKNLLGE